MSVRKCFSVLGNELRIEIIKALKEKPITVNELAGELNAERSNVSHSLSLLKECGFVVSEKKGRAREYKLSNCIVSDMKVTGNLFELMEYHIKNHCREKCLEVKE